MSLRKTTIFAVLLTFVGLVFLLLINLRLILSSYFDSEEHTAIQLAVQRAQAVFNSEISSLAQEAREWAQRADIFRLVASQDQAQIDAGLKTDELIGLNLNFIAWTDSAGNLISARYLDLSKGQVLPLPPE